MVKPQFIDLLRQADERYRSYHDHLPRKTFTPDDYPVDPSQVFAPPSLALTPQDRYVYFLQDEFVHPNLLKIGYTNNLRDRMGDFRTVLPSPKFVAITPGSREFEQGLHDILTYGKRKSFKEWYILRVDEIQSTCDLFWDFDGHYPVVFL